VGAVVLGLAAALLPVLGLLSGLVYVIGISMRLASDNVDDAIKDGAKEVPSFHVGLELNDHDAHAANFAGCVIAIVFTVSAGRSHFHLMSSNTFGALLLFP
jgi:hypothetical protein